MNRGTKDAVVCGVALILIALILLFGGRDAKAHTEVALSKDGTTILIGNDDLGKGCIIKTKSMDTARRAVVLMMGQMDIEGFISLETSATDAEQDVIDKYATYMRAWWKIQCMPGDTI